MTGGIENEIKALRFRQRAVNANHIAQFRAWAKESKEIDKLIDALERRNKITVVENVRDAKVLK